jgi:toxin ParE1/3/4
MEAAAELISADPNRPGSRSRDDLAPEIRSFPVERAARRRGAAAHLLYYVPGTLDDGREGVIILRVLHDRMDPARHVMDESSS